MNTNKKIIGLVIVIAVLFIVAIVWGIKGMKSSTSSGTLPATTTTQTPAEKKESILKIVTNDKVLTQEQKDEIYKLISGSQADQYNFSKEEKLQIIRALNK